TIDKKSLSERDICTKFITPALDRAGWNLLTQVREEVYFTKGRVIVKGKLCSRGEGKRADYVLYFKPNLPIAVIEAKDNNHTISSNPNRYDSDTKGNHGGVEYPLFRRTSVHLLVTPGHRGRLPGAVPCHPH